jgi:DNA-binding FadR family transcriptional regulator
MSDDLGFSETNAIAYIRSSLPKDISESCTNNVILYVIENIWDWYDENGFLSLDIDDEEDDSIDVQEIVNYIVNRCLKQKELGLSRSAIELIVKGELEYEKSIDTFI